MSRSKRDRRIERIKGVEREYLVAVTAVDALEAALRRDPSLLGETPAGQADARNLRANLEATYLVRLFVEFETGLRDVWVNSFHKSAEARVRDVITSLAAKLSVPDALQQNVHAVRKYRNSLVHAEDQEAAAIPVDRARSYLCTFFSRLPPDW